MSFAEGVIITYGPDSGPSNSVDYLIAASVLGISVTVTGTFVGDLVVETSSNNGASWILLDIITAAITRNYDLTSGTGVNLMTNFRVRGNTWTSGRATVVLNNFAPSLAVPVVSPVAVTVGNFPNPQPVSQGFIADVLTIPQDVNTRDVDSTVTPVANGANYITGTPTPGSAAEFALISGFTTMRFQVTGTWTGQLTCEMSMDGGITWTIQGLHQTGTAGEFGSWTANFIAQGSGVAFTHVRIRATALWTGTATVRLLQSINPSSVYIQNAIRIKDQVNPALQAVVKDASTPAVATDHALVVAVSPNSGIAVLGTIPISVAALPLPAGASTSALQTTGNASVASIDTKTCKSFACSGSE